LENPHQLGYVHGDVRVPDILVDKDIEPWLIDFDWSGKARSAHYPGSLNPVVKWSDGAKGGGPNIQKVVGAQALGT
jgi:hypothetical protein